MDVSSSHQRAISAAGGTSPLLLLYSRDPQTSLHISQLWLEDPEAEFLALAPHSWTSQKHFPLQNHPNWLPIIGHTITQIHSSVEAGFRQVFAFDFWLRHLGSAEVGWVLQDVHSQHWSHPILVVFKSLFLFSRSCFWSLKALCCIKLSTAYWGILNLLLLSTKEPQLDLKSSLLWRGMTISGYRTVCRAKGETACRGNENYVYMSVWDMSDVQGTWQRNQCWWWCLLMLMWSGF